jgi:peptidoglycan LD-endopeptidase CwlK
MVCTDLEKLDPRIRPLILQLLADAEAAGLHVKVVETRRNAVRQAECLANKTSKAERSRHQDGMACDIAIIEYLHMKDWNPEGPKWQILGELGEKLGLTWGGRWNWDKPHFELP